MQRPLLQQALPHRPPRASQGPPRRHHRRLRCSFSLSPRKFAIRHSQFGMPFRLPTAFCRLPSGLSQFAMFFLLPSAYCLLFFPCSRAPERSGAPLQPFRCLLPSGLSHSAIRHSQFAMFFLLPTAICLLAFHNSPFEIRNGTGPLTCHVSRFAESFRIPHSAFRI